MNIVERAVLLPFQIDSTGSVATTTDQSKIWEDRVLVVLGTAVGERLQNYYFGSRIHQEVFFNVPDAIAGVNSEVSKAFSAYLPTLYLDSVTNVFEEREGKLTFTIKYRLPNNTSQETKIGSVTIAGNLPIREN